MHPPDGTTPAREGRLAVRVTHPTLDGLDRLIAAVYDHLDAAQRTEPAGRVEVVCVCANCVPRELVEPRPTLAERLGTWASVVGLALAFVVVFGGVGRAGYVLLRHVGLLP